MRSSSAPSSSTIAAAPSPKSTAVARGRRPGVLDEAGRAGEAPELLDTLVRAQRRADPVCERREVVPTDPRAWLVEPLARQGEAVEQLVRHQSALAGRLEVVPYEASRDLHSRRVYRDQSGAGEPAGDDAGCAASAGLAGASPFTMASMRAIIKIVTAIAAATT